MRIEHACGLAVGAALALAGCGKTFTPASYVDKLRILAIRADQPELAPPVLGEDGKPLEPQPAGHPPSSSRIRTLVADPAQLDEPSRVVTLLAIGCTPDPANPAAASLCNSFAAVQDPTAIAAMLAKEACVPGGDSQGNTQGVGISFLGLEVCAMGKPCEPVSLQTPSGAVELPQPVFEIPEALRLESLPPGTPARVLGIQASVTELAIAASPDELLLGADPAIPCSIPLAVAINLDRLGDERERVTGLKRLQIRGPDATDEPNENPAIDGIEAERRPLPAELVEPIPAVALFRRGAATGLSASLPEGAKRQRFSRFDVQGNKIREEDESWMYSWFITAGAVGDLRTRDAGTFNVWTAPTGKKNDPVPTSGRVFLYSVVRDGRGGSDWAVREVRIRD
ncbi:hypothetical protein [Vulgatibacter incomptus]|uniref:Putative lipoprotein n=1 Tax=Vulgatibacter incomptus TaxID=1391653 RepID=A0A0K1PFN8_9BACT|nr:hypothetical protein [Vulgatibacter incomptus]AKU92335.1 putative lipoprotein [Vulgatibacter incomptus]